MFSYIYAMNYLAHVVLSFDQPEILTGNMISDFVKGKKKFDYSPVVQKGIHLHRLIDTFTDFSPITKIAKEFFRPEYRLYSGAFVDVVYDHFLANDDAQFEQYGGLRNYVAKIYQVLEENKKDFPEPFLKMLPYMKTQDWLYNYKSREGIKKGLGGVAYRAAYLNESDKAFQIFNDHYQELEECYRIFFPKLKEYAHEQFKQLMAQ